MKLSDEPINLGRGLLAGLFSGIIIAVVILVFNVIYRGDVDLYTYNVVMPFSIFLVFPLFNLVAGGVYYLFVGHLRKGRPLFILIVLMVMVLAALATYFIDRSTDHTLEEFRGLLVGLELIEGILGAILIPFFASHPTLFLTDKDIRGEE
ncbi:MAG TPA: hypothetical protein VHC96_15670 [Puia sp.]|jgi:hypothetical protein|nr:hypothetical protein [Puia sp.]